MIVLTARGEIEDRVAGLDAGAVDYLVKPFSLAELLARVRAQLRSRRPGLHHHAARGGHRGGPAEPPGRARRAPVQLSTTEFELLVYLLRHRGRVLSREQILSAVWGYQHDPPPTSWTCTSGTCAASCAGWRTAPAPIHTVRAVGYRLAMPASGPRPRREP